jgi:lipopolysaccharide export system permease protein
MAAKKKDNAWIRFLERIGIQRIDRYIIGRFLSTFLFTLALIMAIIVVVDVQEKLDNFMNPALTMREILVYYVAFIPYFAILLAPLFIFIACVFITSKLAARSEIIAMQSAGMSFNRLLRPYMVSAAILSLATFLLSSEVIPPLNRTRLNFTNTWVKNQEVKQGDNVHLAVEPGVIAFFSTFDKESGAGYNFSLEKFEDNTLRSRLTARRIQWDPDSLYHWTAYDYHIRDFEGLVEKDLMGSEIDTMLMITPQDIVISPKDSETLTTMQLRSYIGAQKKRGMGNIKNFQVEYHRRYASIPAAFILTLIAVCLSARKVKGGIGLNVALGLLMAFGYIFFYTISASYAISGAMSPFIAAWLPNLIFIPIAALLYWKAPR